MKVQKRNKSAWKGWIVRAPKRLGKVIRERREREGWTQTGVSAIIGYSNRHISGVERGNPHLNTPGISVLCAVTLAHFFGIPEREVIKRKRA